SPDARPCSARPTRSRLGLTKRPAERARLEPLLQDHRAPVIAHARLPERERDRRSQPRVAHRDDRTAFTTPGLRHLDKSRADTAPPEPLERAERIDPKPTRREIRNHLEACGIIRLDQMRGEV